MPTERYFLFLVVLVLPRNTACPSVAFLIPRGQAEKLRTDAKLTELRDRTERAEGELKARDEMEIKKLSPTDVQTELKKQVVKQRQEIVNKEKTATAGWDAASEATEKLDKDVDKAYRRGKVLSVAVTPLTPVPAPHLSLSLLRLVAVLYCALLRSTMLYYALICSTTLCSAVLCSAMLCCALLCYAGGERGAARGGHEGAQRVAGDQGKQNHRDAGACMDVFMCGCVEVWIHRCVDAWTGQSGAR